MKQLTPHRFTRLAMHSLLVDPTRLLLAFVVFAAPMLNARPVAAQSTAPHQSSESSQPIKPGEPDPNAWPRFLNVNFDGTATEDPDGSAAPRPIDWTVEPRLRWTLDVGEGYGMGTVAAGQYYHFDAVTQPDRFTTAQRLRRINLETGEPVWSQTQSLVYRDLYGYEAGPRTSPTIAGDQIFTHGVGGRLTCRDRLSGKLRWSVDLNERYGVIQNFFGVASSPLVLGDWVIVIVGGSPEADQDVPPGQLDRVVPNGSAVVALDRDSGEQHWAAGDDLASYSSPRTIQLDGETYVLAFTRSGLMLIDPVTGHVQWVHQHRADILESVNAMVPVVDGDRVFISECYRMGSVLLKVNAESAEVIWKDPPHNRRRQAMRSHWSTPVLVDGFLYGCSGRNAGDSDFRCVRLATGEVMWEDSRRRRASVTRVGDRLLVLGERGLLQIVRPTPKRLDVIAQWDLSQPSGQRPALRYPCWAAPVVVGDQVLLRGDSQVLCLELATLEESP